MTLSPVLRDILGGMGVLISCFIFLLHFLGFPVRPLYLLVRNTAGALVFLFLYNLAMEPLGLCLGVNPITVSALALFGVHGFCANNILLLLL